MQFDVVNNNNILTELKTQDQLLYLKKHKERSRQKKSPVSSRLMLGFFYTLG